MLTVYMLKYINFCFVYYYTDYDICILKNRKVYKGVASYYRAMKCITLSKAEGMSMRRLGTVKGCNISHAVYTASKYSSETPGYYVVELSYGNDDSSIVVVSFWKRNSGGKDGL